MRSEGVQRRPYVLLWMREEGKGGSREGGLEYIRNAGAGGSTGVDGISFGLGGDMDWQRGRDGSTGTKLR